MRKPRGGVHVEQSIESVCIIPAVGETEKVKSLVTAVPEDAVAELPNSQAAEGSRREHWQNVQSEARVLRCQGGSCGTNLAGSMREHCEARSAGRRTPASRRKAEAT